MRVDTLHKKMADDVRVVHDRLRDVFPPRMPKCYEHRNMNIRGFIAKLNRATEDLNVFNEIAEDEKDITSVYISGLWNPDRELPENGSNADVRLIWHMHPKMRRYNMTPYHWRRRRFYYYQLLMHETLHRYQNDAERLYRARSENRETKEEQAYYGSTTEIETHAHDAALELRVWWPQLSFNAALAEAKKVSGPTPSTYNLYDIAFVECPSHPAMRHFKRKMRAWYDLLSKRASFYDELQLASLV